MGDCKVPAFAVHDVRKPSAKAQMSYNDMLIVFVKSWQAVDQRWY
jgi:hypothetical protein